MTMEPTATYSGTLVDDNAQPVAGRTLEMYVKTSGNKPVARRSRRTKQGVFDSRACPSNVPLQFSNRYEVAGPECYIVNGDRMFNPDEIRENDRLKLHRVASSTPKCAFLRSAGQKCREHLP